jgi:hypothetical protein
MTTLTNQLLAEKLAGRDGWEKASMQLQEESLPYRTE